jgi:integrase/recombinase XerD
LFHAGVSDTPPRKDHPDKAALRQAQWGRVPARLATTMRGYLAQIRLSLRPGTVTRAEAVLREFACFVADQAPEVGCVADIRRSHIEAYKLHLATRPSARGGRLSKLSLADHLGCLRTFLERLTEWQGPDTPADAGVRRRPAAAR